MTPTLETSRLVLRQWVDDDVDAWAEMNADPQVMEFFPAPYDRAHSEETARMMREEMERDGYGWWVMEVKSGPSFAGVIALQDVLFEANFTPAIEVGWRLNASQWGRGYATEGAQAALRFAFEQLRRNEVVAMTAALNHRSQRVMDRLRMVRDARDDFDHPRVDVGHRLRPHVLYRIDAARWKDAGSA